MIPTMTLHFFDLEAPQTPAPDETPLSWEHACSTVDRAFSQAYPALGSYFREMIPLEGLMSDPEISSASIAHQN